MSRLLRTPLDHPTRRQILRLLHQGFLRHTTEQIAAGLGLGAAVVSYHCAILAYGEKVKAHESSSSVLVESLVAEDAEVLLLLAGTKAEDEAAMVGASGHVR